MRKKFKSKKYYTKVIKRNHVAKHRQKIMHVYRSIGHTCPYLNCKMEVEADAVEAVEAD